MFRTTPRRDTGRVAPRRSSRPAVEGLEERLLLFATSGGQWSRPERITFSFAPDGTSIGGIPSTLGASMAARGLSAAVWQDQFRKAAGVWQMVAGVNLAEVGDSGAAYGVAGNQQNDPRFGDIRIGGSPLPAGSLALAFSPPPYNGGTLAGDIVFSTSVAWNVNSPYDILTVAIHEFGHALGMSHSAITSAVMYAFYNAQKQALTADDTAGIQSIYGPRAADAYDAAAGNQLIGSASNVTSLLVDGRATLSNLDITTSSDYDWYYVATPSGSANSGTLSVTMQSSGLSLLSPRVQLYDNQGKAIIQDAIVSASGGTVTVSASTQGRPGFYVRALAAGATAAGAYGLQINFAGGTMDPIRPPDTTVPPAADQGGGSQGESVDRPGRGKGHAFGLAKQGGHDDLDHVEFVTLGDLHAAGDVMLAGPAVVAAPAPGLSVRVDAAAGLLAVSDDLLPGLPGPSRSRDDRPAAATAAFDRALESWDA